LHLVRECAQHPRLQSQRARAGWAPLTRRLRPRARRPVGGHRVAGRRKPTGAEHEDGFGSAAVCRRWFRGNEELHISQWVDDQLRYADAQQWQPVLAEQRHRRFGPLPAQHLQRARHTVWADRQRLLAGCHRKLCRQFLARGENGRGTLHRPCRLAAVLPAGLDLEALPRAGRRRRRDANRLRRPACHVLRRDQWGVAPRVSSRHGLRGQVPGRRQGKGSKDQVG